MKFKKIFNTKPPLYLMVCITAVLCAAVLNVWLLSSKQQEINTTNEQRASFSAASDALIAQTQARKEQEKIQNDADAKAMAEQAAEGVDPNDSTVNSRVCNRSLSHADPTAIDVVVNKKHCMQPVGFTPSDLITVHGATISSKAADGFNALIAAATAAHQPFYVTSSFRSYESQAATYAYWVSLSGKDGADTYSARPGYSEHQTGLAFDVAAIGCVLDCFGSTSQYTWLQQNAADYGFIQRYYSGYEAITGYKAEEWHYRYVGVEVAKDMKAKGVKTLEQYWNISGGDY